VAYEIVVIGTSWGGLNALRTIAGALPATFALPVVLVQHRHKDSGGMLGSLLESWSALPVTEVEDKQPITPGHLYVAPPDYHLLVEAGYFSLSTEEPVRFSRPSIDVTFESAADSYGARTVGVVLTGANEDGARGLKRIVEAGGYAIVQDPASAEMPIMPEAALRSVPAARRVPLEAIGPHLVALSEGRSPGAAAAAAAQLASSRAP
jgi:two-component system chemotaxis response regulator CheB